MNDPSDPDGRQPYPKRDWDGRASFAEANSTKAEIGPGVRAGGSRTRLGDLFASWLNRFLHPDRRRHRRDYGQPLLLRIDGKKYKTVDWSLGGFRIDGFHKVAKPGDEFSGTIGGGVPTGEFVAEVVRVAESGEVGMRLLEVSPATFLAMSGLRPC